MDRSSSTISYETCRGLMKEHLGEEAGEAWQTDDQLYIISKHLSFFIGVAEHTTRLNPVCLALNAQFLWQMDKHKATLWGKSMAMCMSYIWRAGQKASSGKKLTPEVQSVYTVMVRSCVSKSEPAAKSEVKKWLRVKSEMASTSAEAEYAQVKIEPGPVQSQPGTVKSEPGVFSNSSKRSVMTPAQILKLYTFQITDSPAKKPKVHLI